MTQQIIDIDILSSSDLCLSRTILINNKSPSSLARSFTKAVYRKLLLCFPFDGVRNEEVSSEFRLRKAHWEGEGNACCCLNTPKQFWQRMEIDKQSYLKVTHSENKLIVEKLVDGGHVDNTQRTSATASLPGPHSSDVVLCRK